MPSPGLASRQTSTVATRLRADASLEEAWRAADRRLGPEKMMHWQKLPSEVRAELMKRTRPEMEAKDADLLDRTTEPPSMHAEPEPGMALCHLL